MTEESVKRQRAADRVNKFLDLWEGDQEDDDVIDDVRTGLGDQAKLIPLTVADLRLLAAAAPVLPPKWSALLADPQVHIVQQSGEAWTEAAIRAREVLSVLEARGPEADVFRDGLVGLSATDLETLCNLDGNILFVTFDEARAKALVDGKRTTLSTTSVHR